MDNRPDKRRHSGIALLMSLTIIMLLSVALMKAFENKTVEIAQLSSHLHRFQAETLSRSIFRTILIAVKDKGLIAIMKYRNLWEAPIPLEEVDQGYFQILKIQPMDQLFNLNRKLTSNTDVRSQVFYNLVVAIREANNEDPTDVYEEEIHRALSAIADWIDIDSEPDDVYLYDYEFYPDAEPRFEVKNRPLDLVSEIKLLPPVRELGIVNTNLYKNYFRVVGDTLHEEYIDVNLAQPGEVEAFLERFDKVPKYATVYNNRKTIDEIATTQQPAEKTIEPGMLAAQPRFPAKDFSGRDSIWLKQLELRGIQLSGKEKDLFSPTTEYLRIQFKVGVGKVSVFAESVVRLVYFKGSTDIKDIFIHSFKLN